MTSRPVSADRGLRAHLALARGSFSLDVELDVAAGEVVALLGPNGAGKSTVLRLLAGLLTAERAEVRLAGRVLSDTGSRVQVPPYDRGTGVVFQDYLLFPHLSLADNVAFGLRARGVHRSLARRRAAAWLQRVGLADLAAARPRTVSGGQAQRAALARALAVEPDLLLLDEPLAALDARTRLTVRGELRRHLADFPGAALVVTHDPVDAMVLADRLVVLEAGRVVQSGPPAAVARRPRTDYVARLVGLNLLAGMADGTRVRLPAGGLVVSHTPTHGPVHVAFRPAAVALYPTRPGGSPRNAWPGRVRSVEPSADGVRVEVAGAPDPASAVLAEVSLAAVAELDVTVGREVWASLKAAEVEVYPRG